MKSQGLIFLSIIVLMGTLALSMVGSLWTTTDSDSAWLSGFLQNFSTEILGILIIVAFIDLLVRPQLERSAKQTSLAIEMHTKWHSEGMHLSRRATEKVLRENFQDGGSKALGTTALDQYLRDHGRDEDARHLFRCLHFFEELGKLLETNNVDKEITIIMFKDYVINYVKTEHLIDLIRVTISENILYPPLWIYPTAYLISELEIVDLDDDDKKILQTALERRY
jgi:hypothetical protein